MTARPIRFGTDGWRALIGEQFTIENVSRVAQGIAELLRSGSHRDDSIYTEWGVPYRAAEAGVVIGYDTRSLSEEAALCCATVLRRNEIPVEVSDSFVSTPTVSHAVVEREAALGIVITSSHNPPSYNGLKIKAEFGGSAPQSLTDAVEARIPERSVSVDPIDSQRTDITSPYLASLDRMIEWDRLTAAPLHIVVDPMHGSAQGLVARLLETHGISCTSVRSSVDPAFGGFTPEPLMETLTPLRSAVMSLSGDRRVLGVATDGDGDRVSALDEAGNFVDPHRVYALLLQHLIEERGQRGQRGPIVVSFSLTDLVRRMADAYGLQVIETPIGFKYATEHLIRHDVLMAGEESGGFAIRGYLPERDGALMSLLLAEAVASSSLPPSRMIQKIHDRFGPQSYRRVDLEHPSPGAIEHLLAQDPPERLGRFPVRSVETLDGTKLRFDNGWVLFRASGTEPILRTYCEMETEERVDLVLDEAIRCTKDIADRGREAV